VRWWPVSYGLNGQGVAYLERREQVHCGRKWVGGSEAGANRPLWVQIGAVVGWLDVGSMGGVAYLEAWEWVHCKRKWVTWWSGNVAGGNGSCS
jgi:hypothetical protein